MNRRLSFVTLATGLIIFMVGLLNVVLGAKAIVTGAIPGADPAVNVGSIVLGLVMLIAGAFWTTSGGGYLVLKEWSSILALYVSPVIIAINLAGVLRLWGFVVNIGWAVLSTVTSVGAIWYLSRKELASFFIISVAEHIVIITVTAMLVYSEPVNIADYRDKEVIVTLEETKQQEPLLAEIIPQGKTMPEKQKPPTLPEIEIRDLTATTPGAEIETSAPKLPGTFAQVTDKGTDIVLSASGPQKKEQRSQDTIPALDVESSLKKLKIEPPERKKGPEGSVTRLPEVTFRDNIPSQDKELGPSDQVAKPGFVHGKITGEIVGRKVVSWPNQPEGYKGTESGATVIKFWVDPAGSVVRVEISKKSGSPRLDRMAKEYVEQIRFEELPKNVQRIQTGEIPISFELTR